MVWVLAARNDPFMWLTGWSFAKYNRFHRWIARISIVHGIVHSIAYTMFDLYSDPTGSATTYKASSKEQYWYCGGIATVVMSLMPVASAYYSRKRYYDLFLMFHIGMSLVSFVTLWYHVRIFGGEFNYYLYPCIASWGLDRILRVGRTVFVSVMPRLTKGMRATVTYHRTTEMVRIDLTDFFPDEKVVPGLYYYLYMPNSLRGYESHPFTLCSWHRIAGPLSWKSTSPAQLKKRRSRILRSLLLSRIMLSSMDGLICRRSYESIDSEPRGVWRLLLVVRRSLLMIVGKLWRGFWERRVWMSVIIMRLWFGRV